MKRYTVVLEDGTVGEMSLKSECSIGEIVCVKLHDENGNLIVVWGTLSEILD